MSFLGERIAKDVLNAKYANVEEVNYDYDLVIDNNSKTEEEIISELEKLIEAS